MPLKNVEALKPVISPTTPPPKAIKISDRLNFNSKSLSIIFLYDEKDLDFSPLSNTRVCRFLVLINSFN